MSKLPMGPASPRIPPKLGASSARLVDPMHGCFSVRTAYRHGLGIHRPNHAGPPFVGHSSLVHSAESSRLPREILIATGALALSLLFLIPVLFACFSRGGAVSHGSLSDQSAKGHNTSHFLATDASQSVQTPKTTPPAGGSLGKKGTAPINQPLANEIAAEADATASQNALVDRHATEASVSNASVGKLVMEAANTGTAASQQDLPHLEGLPHEIRSLLHDHNARMRDTAVGRSDGEIIRLPPLLSAAATGSHAYGFIDAGRDHRGVVSLNNHAPERVDYRIDTRTRTGTTVAVDIVGSYASQPNGSIVRNGTWVAWDSEAKVVAVSVYRMGRLQQSHVFFDGVKRRSLSLDDDLTRDEAGLGHRHVVAAMTIASDATLRAFEKIKREERQASRSRTQRQDRLTRQRVQEARRSAAVDHALHAIAYQEAARATATLGAREIFPCVPSRGAYFFTPVNLLGSSPESGTGQSAPSPLSVGNTVIRQP